VAELQALVVDWGGVLTSSLQDTMTSWCDADSIDYDGFRRAMKEWLGTSYDSDVAVNPVHALERGELEVPDFERELAARLRTHDGGPVEAAGLLSRMFAGFDPQPPIADAVRRAKAAGRSTALLSNSWGNDYPREGWEEMFDVVVISGEVGMRKPDPEIYRLTADRLGLDPKVCVFVDDLMPNVRGAVDVGMVGVHHVTPQQTLAELTALFGVSFGDESGV
jgi:epoxide hydrolase-like predicted phosphatase